MVENLVLFQSIGQLILNENSSVTLILKRSKITASFSFSSFSPSQFKYKF